MSQWLNYHHLFYFRTIATEGSIAKAAEKLRLGQPTLSAQLRQLEENLGTPLFDRRHRKLLLNDQGRRALQYANEIFRLGGEMVEVLQDRAAPTRVHLAVGALDSVPKHVILRLTQAAYRRGNCTVSVLEGRGDELMRELSLHRLDLVVANHPPAIQEMNGLRSRRIATEPVTVYGTEKFKGLRKNFPASLQQAPFVWPTRHSKLRHDIEDYFRETGITVDPVAETQDTSFQKLLGVAGVGLLAAPWFAVQDAVRDKTLIAIGELAGVREEIHLIAAARRIENPVAAELYRRFSLGE